VWPAELIRAKRYKRQFDAAVFTLLGAATYAALDHDNRARVDAQVSRTFYSSSTTYAFGDMLALHWAMRAQCRARAMAQLGMPPLGEGLTWERIIPRGFFWPELDLFNRFRPYSPATRDAQEFLGKHGVDIRTEHQAL
jgi:hypothetical protein